MNLEKKKEYFMNQTKKINNKYISMNTPQREEIMDSDEKGLSIYRGSKEKSGGIKENESEYVEELSSIASPRSLIMKENVKCTKKIRQ